MQGLRMRQHTRTFKASVKQMLIRLPAKGGAAFGYGPVGDHAFADGNKRTCAHAVLAMLTLNRIESDYTQTGLSGIFLKTAAGQSGYGDLLLWIAARHV